MLDVASMATIVSGILGIKAATRSFFLIPILRREIDNRATDLVDNTAIFIMPTMNPDGFEMGMRYNANWVDLNRDFPDQFIDNNNSLFGREPETQAVMQWSAEHNFTLSANMHSGALVVN